MSRLYNTARERTRRPRRCTEIDTAVGGGESEGSRLSNPSPTTRRLDPYAPLEPYRTVETMAKRRGMMKSLAMGAQQ